MANLFIARIELTLGAVAVYTLYVSETQLRRKMRALTLGYLPDILLPDDALRRGVRPVPPFGSATIANNHYFRHPARSRYSGNSRSDWESSCLRY